MEESWGAVHSVQSLGTLDGPGVRCVVFLQGCPLRCLYCHNPDARPGAGGERRSAREVFREVLRYRGYFGRRGGLTVSGGEPLAQAGFVKELFSLCRGEGIHTALDTSGCLLTGMVQELLGETDLCLLDVKMTDEEGYRRVAGGSYRATLDFLEELNRRNIPTWLRQVIVPGLNDTPQQVARLGALAEEHSCVEKVELLPFRRLCVEKYRALGLEFPLEHTPEPTVEHMRELERVLRE